MNVPIKYHYEITLRDFKKMLDASNLSIIKMETEFQNQKAFNVFEDGKHLYYIFFTGRVDEWKVVAFNRDNPVVASVIMRGNTVELHRLTNLTETQDYDFKFGTLKETLGVVWALHYWGYLK